MCRVVVRCGASAPSLVPIRGQCVAVSPGDILWHLVTSGVTRVRVWPCLDHVSMLRCASLCSSGASFPPAEIACPSSKPSGLRWLPTQSTQNIWARVSSKMSSEMHDILRNWMTSSVTKKRLWLGTSRNCHWGPMVKWVHCPWNRACWGLLGPVGAYGIRGAQALAFNGPKSFWKESRSKTKQRTVDDLTSQHQLVQGHQNQTDPNRSKQYIRWIRWMFKDGPSSYAPKQQKCPQRRKWRWCVKWPKRFRTFFWQGMWSRSVCGSV